MTLIWNRYIIIAIQNLVQTVLSKVLAKSSDGVDINCAANDRTAAVASYELNHAIFGETQIERSLKEHGN